MKNFNINIMKFDVLSNSGYIYPKDVMETAIKKFNSKYNEDNICLCDNSGSDLDKITHSMSNLYMDEDGVVSADINILDTPQGKILQDSIEALTLNDLGVKAYPKGIATLDQENFTVTDYRYLGVSFKPEQEK